MTNDTAQSLIDVLQRLVDAHIELKAKVTAAEEVFRRQSQSLYGQYLTEIQEETQAVKPSSLSNALVEQLRLKLIHG